VALSNCYSRYLVDLPVKAIEALNLIVGSMQRPQRHRRVAAVEGASRLS